MPETNNERGNILKRLLLTRFELSQSSLKKTGYNKHLQYYYFELDDFLPKLVELCNKNGIATMFSMSDPATLRLVNVDDVSDTWEFSIPMAQATVQGGQAIQNLGSQITYLRRYLLMMAFEISEPSAIEKETGEKSSNGPKLSLTEEEIKKIHECESLEQLNAVCKEMIAQKGIKYKNLIIAEYTIRKDEIGN